MLVWLADFSGTFPILNVFRYITFRAGGATATALLVVFFFGPAAISWLRIKQGKGQPIRTDGPQTHLAKRGTPTMGGLMILGGLLVATLLWGNLRNPYVWIVLGVTVSYGAIGFYDDYHKVNEAVPQGVLRQGAAHARNGDRARRLLGRDAARAAGHRVGLRHALPQGADHSPRHPVSVGHRLRCGRCGNAVN